MRIFQNLLIQNFLKENRRSNYRLQLHETVVKWWKKQEKRLPHVSRQDYTVTVKVVFRNIGTFPQRHESGQKSRNIQKTLKKSLGSVYTLVLEHETLVWIRLVTIILWQLGSVCFNNMSLTRPKLISVSRKSFLWDNDNELSGNLPESVSRKSTFNFIFQRRYHFKSFVRPELAQELLERCCLLFNVAARCWVNSFWF